MERFARPPIYYYFTRKYSLKDETVHLDIYLVLGSAVVGFFVGLTGMGGGALMTPMLVLLFGVAPSVAISSDLVAALFMKPLGLAIHWQRKTVHHGIVKLLSLGSVPAAFLGTYVMHRMGRGASAEHHLQELLGLALVIGASAMGLRALGLRRMLHATDVPRARTGATLLVGVGGGFMVGLTSVGAGSLIMVLLLVLYPTMRSDQLVGTDLAQSLPLTLSASVGAFLFGHVNFALTTSIILGSLPAVAVGAYISSRASGPGVRHLITGVVLLSGLKYLGLASAPLGVVALAVMVLVFVAHLRARRRRVAAVNPAPYLAEELS